MSNDHEEQYARLRAQIEEWNRGVNLFEQAQRDGVQFVKGGRDEQAGTCPKCGGRDRFHVRRYDGKTYFFCRQCHDRRSDALEYVRWMNPALSFEAAVDELSKMAGGHGAVLGSGPVQTTKSETAKPRGKPPTDAQIEALHRGLMTNGNALGFLKGRYGLSREDAETYKLGYIGNLWGKLGPGIVIPVYVDGRCVAARVRSMDAKADWRYMPLTTDCGAWLYNVDILPEVEEACIVEGEFKAMTVSKIIAAVGLPGVDTFIPSTVQSMNGTRAQFEGAWFSRFAHLRRLYIALDPEQDPLYKVQRDPATNVIKAKAPRLWVARLIDMGVPVCLVSSPMKPDDMINEVGADSFAGLLRTAVPAKFAMRDNGWTGKLQK